MVEIVDASLSDSNNSSDVTITFSEVPSDFTDADISFSGGTVSAVASTADAKVFTLTFTATDGVETTGSVTVGTGYTDAAGNTGSASPFIMLDELFRSGRIQPGHKLLMFVPESGRFSAGFIHMEAV